jgi:hypothetical protein
MEFSTESLTCEVPVAAIALCEWGGMVRACGRDRHQGNARTRTKLGRPGSGLAATAALGSRLPFTHEGRAGAIGFAGVERRRERHGARACLGDSQRT